MALHSPYRPGAGVMPTFLAGRAEEISRAESLMAATEHYGTPPAAPLILTGPRGVGKTVTLRTTAARGKQRGFATAHVTFDRHSRLPQRIAAAVAEAVAQAGGRTTGRAAARWRERLEAFSVQLSVSGIASVRTGVQLHEETDEPAERDAIRAVVAEGATLVRDRGRKGLLLTFDEIQEGTEQGLTVVTNVLQDVLGAGTDPVVVVGAGLPNTPDRLMAAGSFAERFMYRELHNLSEREAVQALLNPASEFGVRWSQQAAGLVLEAAQGSPYLLQLYGDSTWRAAAPSAGDVIEEPEAVRGLTEGRSQLGSGLFRGRWNRASAGEQRLLAAVAACLDSSGTAPSAAVAARLGQTAQQLSTTRARLIDKGLLYAPGRGTLAFTMPGFDEFVREQTRG